MRRTILTSIKRILKALFYGLVGGFIVGTRQISTLNLRLILQ